MQRLVAERDREAGAHEPVAARVVLLLEDAQDVDTLSASIAGQPPLGGLEDRV